MDALMLLLCVLLVLFLTGHLAFPDVAGSTLDVLIVVVVVLIFMRLLSGRRIP